MMKTYAMIGAAVVALAGCASEPQAARAFNDPAVQKLYQLPTPQYYATLRIASRLASSCPRYEYDRVLDLELNERRNEEGRGSLSAIALRNQIDLETDVSERSFIAKHGVDVNSGADLCAAADTETAENGAVAAVLIPVS